VARRWVAKKWEEWAIRDDVSVVKCILRLSSVDTKVPYPRAAQVALKAENIDSYWSVTITCAHKKSLPACGSGRPPGGTAPGGTKRVPTRGHPKSQPWHPPEDPIGLLSLKNITNQYDMQRRNRRTWRGLFDFFLKTSIVNAYLLSTWGGFPPNENSNEEDSLSLKNKTYRKFREDLIESL
jgi:hypothetical protein